MEFERFFKFSHLLLRDEFFLSYSGYVSEDILEAVRATLRQQLENHARDGRQIRQVHFRAIKNLHLINSCADRSLACKDPILLAPDRPSWKKVKTNPYEKYENDFFISEQGSATQPFCAAVPVSPARQSGNGRSE